MSVETYPGAVGGFRAMRLVPQGAGPPMMLSYAPAMNQASFEWREGVTNQAICGQGVEHDRVPAWDCKCGFWFYKKLPELRERISHHEPLAYVLLAGWGKIIEHEEGVRCQYARPLVVIDQLPANSYGAHRMGYERWRKWVGKLQMPMATEDELEIAAMMYELDLLDYLDVRSERGGDAHVDTA